MLDLDLTLWQARSAAPLEVRRAPERPVEARRTALRGTPGGPDGPS